MDKGGRPSFEKAIYVLKQTPLGKIIVPENFQGYSSPPCSPKGIHFLPQGRKGGGGCKFLEMKSRDEGSKDRFPQGVGIG